MTTIINLSLSSGRHALTRFLSAGELTSAVTWGKHTQKETTNKEHQKPIANKQAVGKQGALACMLHWDAALSCSPAPENECSVSKKV